MNCMFCQKEITDPSKAERWSIYPLVYHKECDPENTKEGEAD